MIYICIPTHNEQQTVGVVLWKLRQVLTEYPRDYQLLVADDASTDKTQDVLEPYTRVLPLTVIRSDRQQGQAASLEMLLREAARRSEYPKRDVVVTLQADFSEEPDDLVSLLKRMEAGADVAVGTRVIKRKQPFMRRFARKLSGFFVRGHEWPEGVATPFDGYRAYRLHAVKRAIEDRSGRRLLRYDGWACNAELLRAVLPHARRVDVVEVEDRTDRMQRPSREKPMAAAMQVRAAMRASDPEGLIGVEELDRVAATASRARERTTAGNGNGRKSQPAAADGRRERGRARGDGRDRNRTEGRERGERREGRSRTRSEGGGQEEGRRERRPRRERAAGAAGAEAREERQQSPRKREGGQGASGRRERQPRQRQDQAGSQADPSAAPTASVAGEAAPAGARTPAEQEALELLTGVPAGPAASGEDAGGTEAAGAEEGAPKKRRRRRRGRGGRSRSGEGGAEGAVEGGEDEGSAASAEARASANSEGSDDAAGDEGSDGGEAGGEGQRKRRRRGGRRGGRGRRRRTEAGAEGATDGPADSDHGPATPSTEGSGDGNSGGRNPDAPAPTGSGSPDAEAR